MKFLENIIKKTKIFQRTLGLTNQQFNLLVNKLAPHWEKAEKQRKLNYHRRRKIGAGHPYKHQSLHHKLLIVLLYYKLYVTQEFLGLLIDMDQANVSRLLQKMLPLIEQAADPELATYLNKIKEEYAIAEKTNNLPDFFERHPDLKDVAFDATEQQRFRPKNEVKQKEYYSGKKKKHTIKTQASVARTGRALDISNSYPGSIHDKKIIDHEKTIEKFPEKSCLRGDSGYQGIKQLHPDHYIVLPTKKPKGQKLSDLAKE